MDYMINSIPTLESVSDLNIRRNSGTGTIPLNGISDGGFNGQLLSVKASSSNVSSIPDPIVHYTSPETTGILEYKPALYGRGDVTITVRVEYTNIQTAFIERKFTIRVTDDRNSAPGFQAGFFANIDANYCNTKAHLSVTGLGKGFETHTAQATGVNDAGMSPKKTTNSSFAFTDTFGTADTVSFLVPVADIPDQRLHYSVAPAGEYKTFAQYTLQKNDRTKTAPRLNTG